MAFQNVEQMLLDLHCVPTLPRVSLLFYTRVPTQPGKPGKPGKMRVHLENLEISWNFENLINIMEK